MNEPRRGDNGMWLTQPVREFMGGARVALTAAIKHAASAVNALEMDRPGLAEKHFREAMIHMRHAKSDLAEINQEPAQGDPA